MKFKGTVIITDPCYFVKDEDWNEEIWDYKTLDHLGFETSIVEDTLYGDWSCVTMRTDKTDDIEGDLEELFEERNWKGLEEKIKYDTEIGKFCADAGMVSVILKEDLDRYDPNAFDNLKPHMATVIENYDGNINTAVFNDKHLVIIGDNFYTAQE